MSKTLPLAAMLLIVSCGTSRTPLEGSDSSVLGPDVSLTPVDAATPTDAGRPPHLAIDCFRYDAHCHPVDSVGCEDGARCDFARDTAELRLVCQAVDARRAPGETCSDAAGSFCTPGLRCHEGTCKPTCCASENCTNDDEVCVAHDVAWGSLGVCTRPPACREPGAECARASECCSNDCHASHCH